MKIALCGPFDTEAYRLLSGLDLADAPNGVGGMPLTDLAQRLRTLGHEVHVVTTDHTVLKPKMISEDGFSATFCPIRATPGYRARVRALDLFEREIRFLDTAIRDLNPDIVHAHWTYEFAEAAVRSRYPHLVTMHDLGWNCFWQFRDAYRFMRLVMKYRTMPRVKNLTVVAPFMTRKTRQYGYFGPISVVPNGIDFPPSIPQISKRDLSRPILVTVGDNGPIKNVRTSVEAFRLIRMKMPNAELHLFGPGLDANFAKGVAGIFRHGNLPHSELMKFLIERATVLIHPSRLETFGVIIAEAKAVGVPVIAGRKVGGVPYVCDDRASILVDIERPQEIADGVIRMLENKNSYESAALKSRQDVERRFASSIVTAQYVSVYEKILNHGRR